jgi:hypothetical protein
MGLHCSELHLLNIPGDLIWFPQLLSIPTPEIHFIYHLSPSLYFPPLFVGFYDARAYRRTKPFEILPRRLL